MLARQPESVHARVSLHYSVELRHLNARQRYWGILMSFKFLIRPLTIYALASCAYFAGDDDVVSRTSRLYVGIALMNVLRTSIAVGFMYAVVRVSECAQCVARAQVFLG